MSTTLINAFVSFSNRHPLATTSIAGFFIASIGDVCCQKYFERKDRVDWKRTAEMGAIRATVMAPFLSLYFPRLAKHFPGTSFFAVARRIVADQIFGSPVAICMVFTASCIIQGHVLEVPNRIQQQLLPTWLSSIEYWPFAHIITFKFVPVRYQAHFANFLSVYWNMVRELGAGRSQLKSSTWTDCRCRSCPTARTLL